MHTTIYKEKVKDAFSHSASDVRDTQRGRGDASKSKSRSASLEYPITKQQELVAASAGFNTGLFAFKAEEERYVDQEKLAREAKSEVEGGASASSKKKGRDFFRIFRKA